jgi:hypothetical protein
VGGGIVFIFFNPPVFMYFSFPWWCHVGLWRRWIRSTRFQDERTRIFSLFVCVCV